MKIKNLKVGDMVFIREDLEAYCNYGGCIYTNEMKSGVGFINEVFSDGAFRLKGIRKNFYYTPEMIDWKKTERINSDIESSNRIENSFKEITQIGMPGAEITTGVIHDGEKISVKNNGEKNDTEKAVMLLMLKQRGVTYTDVKREVEKVKIKWEPKQDEKYYWVNKYLEIDWYVWEGHVVDKMLLKRGNCFETRKEAEEKLEKIKEILKGE